MTKYGRLIYAWHTLYLLANLIRLCTYWGNMIRNLSLFLLFTCIFFSTFVLAQTELDSTFNSTGTSIITAGSTGTTQDMVVQPDNKAVFVGSCDNVGPVYPFCLFRVNEGGTFDQSFDDGQGHPGVVLTAFPGNPTSAGIGGIALQNDGKLVGAGYGGGQIVLVRYNSNGTLDTSFATNGILQSNMVANATVAKILIQPDGKYVVVGSSGSSTFTQYVARFLPDGTPDASFGSGGVTLINIAANQTIGLSIALQADGKIVTGGGAVTLPGDPNPLSSFLLARLNRDGTLDTTFDGDGLKIISSGAQSTFFYGIFRSLAVQSDGRILALGATDILFRFNTDGSLDTTFDGDGSRVVFGTSIPIYGPNSETFDLTVTPGGKITVVGNPSTTVDFPDPKYIIARYLPTGAPDASFSGDGFLSFGVGSGWSGALTVAPDSKGRTVIGGRTSNFATRFNPWNTPLFSAARLIASPTQNVGFSGRVMNSDGKPVINGFVTLTKDSETIAVGRTNPFGYFNFKNIPTNQTYTLSTRAKNLNFNTQSVLVDDAITNFLIIGERQ